MRERGGRLFILGVGGGAGHASHAVNDFRKLCRLESYAPTDNVSELTARTNDDGWESSFTAWLRSRDSHSATRCWCSPSAAARASTTSRPTSSAPWRPRESVGATIYGVVGAPGGTLAELADVAILIDPPADLRTPLVEAFQAVVWHALVSHPELALQQGHWETLVPARSRERGLGPPAEGWEPPEKRGPLALDSPAARTASPTAPGRVPRPRRRSQRGRRIPNPATSRLR